MRQHAHRRVHTPKTPDEGLRATLRLLAPEMSRALSIASDRLAKIGAKPAICGGLAVGIYGAPRATSDIDFLVGEAIYRSRPGALIVELAEGVPVEVMGVPIDCIPESETATVDDIVQLADGYRVVTLPALATMKLEANRPKDRADVRALIDAGAIDDEVLEEVSARQPSLGTRLERMLRSAR